MELPVGYTLRPSQSLQEVDLYAPNQQVIASFTSRDDPGQVTLTAYRDEARVCAAYTHYERALSKRRR